MSHARRTGVVKGSLERCLTTTVRRVPSGSYALQLSVGKIRVRDVLDDLESEKWQICRARRPGTRKAGCLQVLDDSELSNTKFGCNLSLGGNNDARSAGAPWRRCAGLDHRRAGGSCRDPRDSAA